MSDPLAASSPRARLPWPVLGLGIAAAGAPVGLAIVGEASPWSAAAVSTFLIVAGLVVAAFMRRAARAVTPIAGPPPARTTFADREPPFAIILEHIVDPIILVAGIDEADIGDRRFVFANAAARDLLRIQRPDGPLTTAVRAPEILAAVEGALFARETRETLYETRGVQERFWRVCVTPLAGPEWGPGGDRLALLTLRDETEVRRSERTRANFLANASHELRTPLASLAGFVETLRGHARDDAEARERFLGIMHAQAERMRRLIDDLTSLSRIELGEHIPPSGRVDMR